MERQHKPPPLSLSPSNGQSSSSLSVLSYHRTPSAYGMPPTEWELKRTSRKSSILFTTATGALFLSLLLITGVLTWLLIHPGTNLLSPLSQVPSSRLQHEQDPSRLPRPEKANSTLNFQQIFAINLPARVDRKDVLTVMALYHNLSITIVPGVRNVAENALPPPKRPGSLRPEEYNVWRAHANVWRRIVEEKITTALIMEDDNDWDVKLKHQVPRVLNALEEIRVPVSSEKEQAVVRGGEEVETWDILYLGSCFEGPTLNDKFGRRVMVPIPSDNGNVASHNYNWVEEVLRKHGQLEPPTRILQRSSIAQCTHSYALTERGARKLLYYTSLKLDKRLDMAIVDLVQAGHLNAFSVVPPLMVQWRTAERAGKDTDVGYDVWPVNNWGFAHSTRKALRKENQVGYNPNPDDD